MTRDQTTPDAPKRLLDMPVPQGDRVRDDAGQRVCAVAGDAAGVQGGAGHVGAGSGDAAGVEGVAAGRRGELSEWIMGSPARAKPWLDAPIQVWLDNGSVRLCRVRGLGCYSLLDCRHPMDNVILDGERIQAWRFASGVKTLHIGQ